MYILREPAPALSPYIEHYWFVFDETGGTIDLTVDVFVDCRADLIFNFGAPYRREIIHGEATTLTGPNFDAQRLFPIRIEQRGRARVCGVRFKLGGVAAFTRTDLSLVSGTTAPVAEIFGASAVELEAGLRREPDVDAAQSILDGFFTTLLERYGLHPALAPAIAALESSDGTAPLSDVAATAEVSARHLERLFARGVGFTPKTVARVLRFQHALRRLMTDPDVPLGELATAVGYFDQPHFVKDFWQFTGGVPRGYRGYYPPDAPRDFAPNVVVFLQDLPGTRDAD